MSNEIRFYDTCSLLNAGESVFDKEEKFVVSSITFKELERIKTASNKDLDVKYSARLLLHLFEEHPDMYDVVVHRLEYEEAIKEQSLDITDDTRILSDAFWYNNKVRVDETVFVTNDLSLKTIANLFFGSGEIESVESDNDDYSGYVEIKADDSSLASFYQDPSFNHYNLHIGEYLIIRDLDGKIVDIRVWTGENHRYLNYNNFDSIWFGNITPYKEDVYQKLLFDSLSNNRITLIKGPPGSGKTIISLAYLMSKLDRGDLDRIVVFCNTVATANSAKLGYLPGTRNEKLLDSQIGNLLISKFGGRDGVEQLIETDKLVLLPMSDIRGYDTSGMKAGIYISEAQNLDRTLIKLALQRVGEDCVCIIDGDAKTQVDDIHFAGSNNGMKRVSKVYRGHDIYGEVELRNIYRSRIAQIAEYI